MLQELLLPYPLQEPFAPSPQRLVDGLGRGGEPPLQYCQSETHGPLASFVIERVGAVELLAHVVGDLLVEVGLHWRERIIDRIGEALGEERLPIKLEQLLLD